VGRLERGFGSIDGQENLRSALGTEVGLTHDRDRTARMAQHVSGDLAYEEARDRREATRSDNDPVRANRLRARENLAAGIAGEHGRRDRLVFGLKARGAP